MIRERGVGGAGSTVALYVVCNVPDSLPHGAGVVSFEAVLNALLVLGLAVYLGLLFLSCLQ